MKKLVLFLIFIPLVWIQCKSDPPTNKQATNITDSSTKASTIYYRNQNNERIKIDYLDFADGKGKATIHIGETSFEMPKINREEIGEYFSNDQHLYTDNGVIAFRNGDMVMVLEPENKNAKTTAKSQRFKSIRGESEITVDYQTGQTNAFVVIDLPDGKTIQLPQKEQWNIGARYDNGEYQWVIKGNKFLLIKKGDIPVVYKQI